MEWIKRARKQLEMSQLALSVELGCSQGCLCNWERGHRTPHLNEIRRIVAYFKQRGVEVSAAEVLEEA